MTTPTSHHPRRGRMAVAAAIAVVLVVAGLVLFATAGSHQPGDPAQAIAGAPSSTSTTPNAPDPPTPAGAAWGHPVSTPGHPSPGAVADGPVSTPGGDAGAPAPPAVSGVPAPGTPNGAGQPGSSSGPANGAVPGAAIPGQSGSSSNAAPGDAAGNTSGTAPGGPAGSPGNPGTVASSDTGGGGSGVSDAARTAALAGAPTMPPNTLTLPSLGVGPAPLGPVCSEPGGSLEPPVNAQGMLCTWRGSSPPTAGTGETTLAGHINYNHVPGAAFARLSQMRPGDPIYLRGATGGTQTWIVRSEFSRSKTLPLDNNAFAGPDGPRSLALVSCGGNLIPGERSYADNIYVFATPV